MVIMGIFGELGTGKTLTLTYMLHTKFHLKKVPVFANYSYKYRKKFLKSPSQIVECKNGCLGLDEIWLWLDSREFMKKTNKVLSNLLLKSRRVGLHICYTAQDFSQVDKRLRNITDLVAYPELSTNLIWCVVPVYQRFSGKLVYTLRFRTKEIFDLYDHEENLDYLDEPLDND